MKAPNLRLARNKKLKEQYRETHPGAIEYEPRRRFRNKHANWTGVDAVYEQRFCIEQEREAPSEIPCPLRISVVFYNNQ